PRRRQVESFSFGCSPSVEPFSRYALRHDCQDLSLIIRNIVKDSNFPDSKAILRSSKTSKALDSTLACFPWLVPKVRFDTIANLSPDAGTWKSSKVLHCLWGEDDFKAQSG